MSTFNDRGEIDPARGAIITCIGKKGSGKSVMGLLYFRAYPGDKIVIDVAGDDGPIGDDVILLQGTVNDLPKRLPQMRRDGDKPLIWRYAPDPGSDTFIQDVDAVVGMVINHGQCCILVHEIGVVAPAGRTPPNMRRLLMHSRHNGAKTGIFCGPRPQDIDRLVKQQADLLYTFDLQGDDDRVSIAKDIGWNPREFSAAIHALGPFEHALFDANVTKPTDGSPDTRLQIHEALPKDVADSVIKWAKGQRPRERR